MTESLTADEKAEVARFGIHDEELRWKVACVNWGFPDAAHALTYVLIDGEACLTRMHPTWEDAILWLNESGDKLQLWAETLLRNRRGDGEDESW